MNIQIILVEFATVILQVLCEKSISFTDNLRTKIALEVLKVSPVSTVVSPFALSLPLCKLASVARGHAKFELMSALGIERESEIEKCFSSVYQEISMMKMRELMIPNAIYLNESLELDAQFTNNSIDYGVRISKVGFQYPTAAVRFMNRWFAQETLYRVSTLIDEDDIDNTTSIVILNGLYYRVAWEMPFHVEFTKPKKFYDSKDRFWMIPMIAKIDSFFYLDDVNNKVKILDIKMATPDVSMTFFLPETKTGLPDLIKKLADDPQMIQRIKVTMKPKTLKIYLPRMKIKSYVDWTGFMRLIGINDVFSVNGSGLEGMLKNNTKGHVYLSKAKQKVFLEMDEMATDLKRRDPVFWERTEREFSFGDNLEQVEFDRPFFFIIGLTTGGKQHNLLTGVFHGPQEEFM